ncbi:sensor histidine kinase [Mucilaginibacter glaciei]|uniref:Sensor histidine kinase n=1 Tax=Mucilaginibacter glaciei TaxID=2772109 RepID=A0A926NG95_9SPHI|nr:histidine kinase [Mucilaginibacter glaciei]MBD1391544.1 sensor histidine kinase [Mucilaginibacter glaciei]
MFKFKLSTTIIHITGWLLFLLLPVLFLNSGNKSGSALLLFSSPFYWLFAITYLALFYFNIWYAIPAFFLKGRYLIYGVLVLITFGGVFFLQPFDKLLVHNPRFQQQMEAAATRQDSVMQAAAQSRPRIALKGFDTVSLPFGPLPNQDLRMQEPIKKQFKLNPLWEHSKPVDIVSLVLFFIITALALSVRTVEQWRTTEQKVIKTESEKVTAELSFLKAQINPHFLFNTLNNIYTLSVMNSKHTSESIMKLSNIMRYVTDDVTRDFVPLNDDLKCIKDYIDLQKLRLGPKTIVTFNITGDTAGRQIVPLILMSFVENTFKYGISKKEQSEIVIDIKAEVGSIIFFCQNKIFNRQITERSGIGIANTKQRLQHLYAGKYMLNIREADEFFRVDLVLKDG